jgi:hypothetical protein
MDTNELSDGLDRRVDIDVMWGIYSDPDEACKRLLKGQGDSHLDAGIHLHVGIGLLMWGLVAVVCPSPIPLTSRGKGDCHRPPWQRSREQSKVMAVRVGQPD